MTDDARQAMSGSGGEAPPLVTAVIPVYNHERYVEESLRSMIAQSYENIELIVINDGSKDGSHEKVLGLVDACRQRFRRFEYRNRENRGLTNTLNEALEWAQGEYLTALASDDIALPQKVSLLVEALEKAGETAAAAFGNARIIDDDGREVVIDQREKVWAVGEGSGFDNYLDFRTDGGRAFNYRSAAFGTFPSLLRYNYLPAMSNVVRTALVRAAGGWTVGNVSEDWEMWRKLSKERRFLYIDEPVALYRWHQSNSVKTMATRLKQWSLALLTQEKDYCRSNGLAHEWSEAYIELWLPVVMDRNVPLYRRFMNIDFVQLLEISPLLAMRVIRRAFRTIKGSGSP